MEQLGLMQPSTQGDIVNFFIRKHSDKELFSARIDCRVKFEIGVYPLAIRDVLMKNVNNQKGNCKRRSELKQFLAKERFYVKNSKTFCLVCLKRIAKGTIAVDHPFVENVICHKCIVSKILLGESIVQHVYSTKT